MKTISKYSFGIGDRFAHEGVNQLKALIQAEKDFGVHFTPVWNKSNREHTIIGTEPMSTRQEADAAVKALGYKDQYFCDADHINRNNVDKFIEACDFFTIDVADYIGKSGSLEERYLPAVREAGKIYRHIAEKKGADNFVTEVSMDEVDVAQTPEEIKYILTELAKEKVPLQTFAPKFTGRFNKGVDYVGDLAQFAKEFEEDLKVIAWAVKELGLPANLKLSIHSGSDKFSIYPIMGRLIRKYDAGIHVKTAGTTWLGATNLLSIAVMAFVQLPALRRTGVRLRFRIDLHGPGLAETLRLALPAIACTAINLVGLSVMNSCALHVAANGPASVGYAWMWYQFPYGVLGVALSTAMFTEMSDAVSRGETERFKEHLLAGLLDGHALLRTELGEELGIFFGLRAGGRVDDGGLSDVLQAELVGEGMDFIGVSDQDDFCKFIAECHIGRRNGALLEALGKHDALLVGLGTGAKLFDEI